MIWAYRCERFVEEAYGTRYQFASARIAAEHLALHRGPITAAPSGTLVFFGPDSANKGYGHVGLSLGGGMMLSALETVRTVDVSKSRYWSHLYRGWAEAPSSWPGRIPPPPGAVGPLVSSRVQITAPAFAATTSGVVQLEAAAEQVGGVAFEAYYATDPNSSQTVGWHLIGNATLIDGSWSLQWNSATVPDQGNALWGTVNLAAIARDASGNLTGTRDYRRISVNNGGGSPTGVAPIGVPSTPVTSPQTTYSETTGGVTHTWTDYTNAGGSEGPAIPTQDTVQVACKVGGFVVADGNAWWYRIESSPWNGTYYGSADAFYNNGQTSGSLIGTPFFDPNVPTC